jgi:hypothetical protein
VSSLNQVMRKVGIATRARRGILASMSNGG